MHLAGHCMNHATFQTAWDDSRQPGIASGCYCAAFIQPFDSSCKSIIELFAGLCLLSAVPTNLSSVSLQTFVHIQVAA